MFMKEHYHVLLHKYINIRIEQRGSVGCYQCRGKLRSKSCLTLPQSPPGPVPDAFILGVGNDSLAAWMEYDIRDIVIVPAARVHLPRACFVVAPQLDLPIIRSCSGKCWGVPHPASA